MRQHQMVRWENPPPPAASTVARVASLDETGGVWRDVADALKARPGVWALVRESGTRSSMTSLCGAIRFGVFHDFRPPLAFDAVVRFNGGVSSLYARYAPGDDE